MVCCTRGLEFSALEIFSFTFDAVEIVRNCEKITCKFDAGMGRPGKAEKDGSTLCTAAFDNAARAAQAKLNAQVIFEQFLSTVKN